MSVYITRELEMHIEKLRLYSSKHGFVKSKPAIVFKDKMFNSWIFKILFYPLYIREYKQFVKDEYAVNQVKEAGKDLRNRDIALKVLMSSDDVKEEGNVIGVCSEEHHDWNDMFDLYLRNMFYKDIYKTKLLLLENINLILVCKSLDKEKSSRYLKLLKNIKQELKNDIPQGGSDK